MSYVQVVAVVGGSEGEGGHEMPNVVHPGVFIEEIPNGPRPIVALPTSHAAFVGRFEKGPVGEPHKVTSIGETIATYGEPTSSFPASLAVWQYFLNGGSVAWIVRLAEPGPGETLRPIDFGLEGTAATPASGIFALDDVPDSAGARSAPIPFNLLVLADMAHLDDANWNTAYTRAYEFCERRRTFLVADPPMGVVDRSRRLADQVHELTSWFDASAAPQTSHAAAYLPRLIINDPLGGGEIETEASGTIAGVIARSDVHRGVWHAAAGTSAILRGVERLVGEPDEAMIGRLNAIGLNSLRTLPDKSIVVWGARTAGGQRASEWKFVPVRRLADHVLNTVEAGLSWTVFEPNDEPLWASIRSTVGDFLESLFRQGAFPGARSNEAYFVKCGRDTMTQVDLDAGRCIVEIGVAPLKPAEFVRLRLVLRTQL